MSRRRKEATSIPKHRHCPVCGISIGPESQFCSLNCKKKYERFIKRRERMEKLYLLLPLGFVVLFIVLQVLGRVLS